MGARDTGGIYHPVYAHIKKYPGSIPLLMEAQKEQKVWIGRSDGVVIPPRTS
jgi:hypothetical protein